MSTETDLRSKMEEVLRHYPTGLSTVGNRLVGVKSDETVIYAMTSKEKLDERVTDTDEWKDIVMVSADNLHSVGLKSDGTVIATGPNENGETLVEEWSDIVFVETGSYHTLGLKSDGKVVAVGGDIFVDDHPELNKWKSIVSVVAGVDYTVGLKSDGTVVAKVADSAESGMKRYVKQFNDWTVIYNPGISI